MAMGAWSSLEHSDEIARVTALGGAACGNAEAARILHRASALGTDTNAVLSSRFGIAPETLYRRLADDLGVQFRASTGRMIAPLAPGANLDALSSVTTARGHVAGAPVLFIAPGFNDIAPLKRAIARDPDLAGRLCVVPPYALRQGLAEANGAQLLDFAVQRLTRCFPPGNAHLELTFARRAGYVLAIGALAAVAFLAPLTVQALLLPLLTAILSAPSVFRLWAAATAGKSGVLNTAILLGDAQLPVYSVLVPLRDEAHMVPQIAEAMCRIDYPAEKLEIVLVVESSSPRTVAAARSLLGDQRFSLVVVPRRAPLTKPKALNFALPLVRGEHVVVYDAEDVPDRQQLRRAATLFAQNRDIGCLQAELLISNGDRNWLTRMFAAEYAGHFAVLLPAMGRVGLPMPLGGTSNHFRGIM